MSSYNLNRVGRLVAVVVLAVCLVAGYYITKASSAVHEASVAEVDVAEGEALKQPLKKSVDMKDKAFTGFKPF